jgi:hypothetical protein
MQKSKTKKRLLQLFASLIALAVISTGVRYLMKDASFYQNWWGGLVFAPLTVLVGLFFLYLVIFKWDKLSKMK